MMTSRRQHIRSLAVLLLATLFVDGFSVVCPGRKAKRTCILQSSDNENNDDGVDWSTFDPFSISPLDFPNETDAKPTVKSNQPEKAVSSKRPFGLDLMGFGLAPPGPPSQEQGQQNNGPPPAFKSKFASKKAGQGEEVDILDVFDPTLSPHFYKDGVPSTKQATIQATTTIGIILMDHGSRNDMSNQRLHDLARLYQNSFDCDVESPQKVIVRAAHMEIASPSIPQVLKDMIQSFELDEIVCHPFFLSPGRHVQEDVPRILQDAVESLGIDIPLKLTAPVGSSTQLMINAIHSMVEESSLLLNSTRAPNHEAIL